MNQTMGTSDVTNKDERMWGMLCHLTAFAGFIIPLGNVLGPLIIWLIKKDEMPFVDDQGKESLNFQITMLIAFIISFVLMFIVIGLVLMGILAVFQIVILIIASIKANDGVRYRYPYAIRFIK
ncbi:MAG: DUF4870 domain-containing protein [Gammaproteobacteria bacterium]|nr:DUF4870 domain-containing protein [Gammaproteobacteria bacterium]